LIKNNKMTTQQVFCGDNIELLKQYPDNHFDSIVTDAPYGLGKEPNAVELMKDWVENGYHEISGSGFMGKEWDAFVPQPLFWKEAFRVLKHGGHVLSFFGTRTYDWGVMAMRFAGFEVRDTITWHYGCLSDDTEIFTKNGWIRYSEYSQFNKTNKSSILVYNYKTDEYFFEKPERWNEYAIKDTCYRIKSDNTDQIVSRNHRCLIEREGKLLFEFAEKIAQERKATIPILEILPKLPKSFSSIYKRASNKKQNLLQKMFFSNAIKENDRENKTNSFEKSSRISLSSLQKNIFDGKFIFKKINIASLLKKMQWLLQGATFDKTRTQGSESVVRGNKRKLSFIYDGTEKPILEGWNNLSKEEGILFGSQTEICEMPEGVYPNVKEGRLYTRVQINNGETDRSYIDKDRVRTSYRPQPNEQRYNEFDAICNEQGTQEVRMGKSYSTTLATIEPIEYTGVIFCPTVSTGAFVARRNGKIFITGNSGFPKSHNISKALDKMVGAEREVIGKGVSGKTSKGFNLTEEQEKAGTGILAGEYEYTAPSTEAAKKWDGWGSAIKPASEPIVLARKPLEKGLSIAENVLKWGTGGINIDGCRVALPKDDPQVKLRDGKTIHAKGVNEVYSNGVGKIEGDYFNTQGRFPANVIFSHHEDCVCNGTKEVKAIKGGTGEKSLKSAKMFFAENKNTISCNNQGGVGDANGNETVENWTCVDGCPIKELDEQSGVLKSGEKTKDYPLKNKSNSLGVFNVFTSRNSASQGGASRFFYTAKSSKGERNKGLEEFQTKQTLGGGGLTNCGDAYGSIKAPAKNFHPTIKPVKLMQYLVRLITPPNGIVLDPFNGSGTTGIAAKLEGLNYVGLELDAEYCKISEARIAAWEIEKPKTIETENDNQLNLF